MVRLYIRALSPKLALALVSDVIRPSRVVGGLGSQRIIVPPTKPAAASFGKGIHRMEACSVGYSDARASNKRIQFH